MRCGAEPRRRRLHCEPYPTDLRNRHGKKRSKRQTRRFVGHFPLFDTSVLRVSGGRPSPAFKLLQRLQSTVRVSLNVPEMALGSG